MKKVFYAIAISASIFTGCSSNDDEPIVKAPVEGEISGDITSNKTFAYGNYTLKGMVKIAAGVTVTIEKGSTITADKRDGEDGLVVLKNGTLIANGTADEPIVLTEQSKVAGSWAGIIMYGDAPMIGTGGVISADSEDGLKLPYGGANENHSSGSLKFVRVEYAGLVITSNQKEHNGFSFYAVGAGTVLENLVSYKGNDDGFEFYGGTVSGKNLISYGNSDDAFDWQDSWKGQNNTNWFAYQTGKANYGMEVEAKGNNNAFWPKVTNITLKRAAGTTTEAPSGEVQLDAIQFKSNGNGDFSNIVIDGYVNQTTPTSVTGGAVQVLDLNTYTNQVVGGKIKLTNVKISGTPTLFISGAGTFTLSAASFPGTNWGVSTTATGAALTSGKWATVDGVNLLANL
ncbi:hypothetical protein [Pedobacter hiemivivus]|uniref:T9SS C-terminal target domain-containing protein n=1 Tax=Pedobacter hiemivivus TaxID=2530454 RepID=A0A4R0N743_9SPHI|nr:hypothetical protein [Pedobacter hiemivivus]TCC95795.1 hypothetical protein EZ444_14355 [Pedobacter hiemivivus]